MTSESDKGASKLVRGFGGLLLLGLVGGLVTVATDGAQTTGQAIGVQTQFDVTVDAAQATADGYCRVPWEEREHAMFGGHHDLFDTELDEIELALKPVKLCLAWLSAPEEAKGEVASSSPKAQAKPTDETEKQVMLTQQMVIDFDFQPVNISDLIPKGIQITENLSFVMSSPHYGKLVYKFD